MATRLKICSQYMSDNFTIENAVIFFLFIVSGAKSCYSTKFRSFFCESVFHLYERGYLKELSMSNFSTLIAHDNINVETEDVIFSIPMEIINTHTPERDINRCVGLIRFHQMSTNFLLDVVQLHPVMLTQERRRLVRETLRYQLTNQPSPTIAPASRLATSDVLIYSASHKNVYRY